MKIYDISIPLSEQTPVWEGDEKVKISRDTLISAGADYNVSLIEMGVHAGTHVDAPYHVFDDGFGVDRIPLDHLVGRAQVVRIPDEVKTISADVLKRCNIDGEVKHLLFKTRNSQYWKAEKPRFHPDFTALDTSGAAYLAARGVKLTGIDWFSISIMDDLKSPHMVLLKAGIVIVENLNLADVPAGFYDLYCLPLKLVGTDGAPARVILTREE